MKGYMSSAREDRLETRISVLEASIADLLKYRKLVTDISFNDPTSFGKKGQGGERQAFVNREVLTVYFFGPAADVTRGYRGVCRALRTRLEKMIQTIYGDQGITIEFGGPKAIERRGKGGVYFFGYAKINLPEDCPENLLELRLDISQKAEDVISNYLGSLS